MEERKGAKAEREWNERGGRAKSHPGLRSRPDTSPGMLGGDCAGARADGGRGEVRKRTPQSLLWAPFLPGIQEKPGNGLVFQDAHMDSTISPPPRSSRGWAASAVLAAAAQAWRGWGGGRGDPFLAAPERGSVCSDCPLTSLRHKHKISPRRCWRARLPGWGRSLPVVLGKGGSLGL